MCGSQAPTKARVSGGPASTGAELSDVDGIITASHPHSLFELMTLPTSSNQTGSFPRLASRRRKTRSQDTLEMKSSNQKMRFANLVPIVRLEHSTIISDECPAMTATVQLLINNVTSCQLIANLSLQPGCPRHPELRMTYALTYVENVLNL